MDVAGTTGLSIGAVNVYHGPLYWQVGAEAELKSHFTTFHCKRESRLVQVSDIISHRIPRIHSYEIKYVYDTAHVGFDLD